MKNKSKKIIISTIALILIATFLGFRKNNDISSIQIKDIQNQVGQIDSIKDYQIKTLNNQQVLGEHITDGGAQLIGYYRDGKTSKIVEKLGLSFGVKTYEYYFFNNQLIFVHEKDENFPYDEKKDTFDYSKLESGFEGFYYFKANKLVSTETSGEKRFPSGEEVNMGELLIRQANENIDLFASENN